MVQIGMDPAAESSAKAGNTAISQEALPTTTPGGSAAIARRLRHAILEGAYGYGERLPAERELAGHFSASRTTVRQALRQLEEARLVNRKIGSGTFVCYRAPLEDMDIAELTNPIELIEVRLGIEPRMARLAAVNATARDLERLHDALKRTEAAGSDREAFSRADEKFHLLLAEATHNPLMVWLYQQINEVRGHAQWDGMKDKILTAEPIAMYNSDHRRLYEALRNREVDAAAATITTHLERARKDLLGAE